MMADAGLKVRVIDGRNIERRRCSQRPLGSRTDSALQENSGDVDIALGCRDSIFDERERRACGEEIALRTAPTAVREIPSFDRERRCLALRT
jgi:hypothetical protein